MPAWPRACSRLSPAEGINIKVITTSEIKISVLIDRKVPGIGGPGVARRVRFGQGGMTLEIVPERPGDEAAIYDLTALAFAGKRYANGTEAEIPGRLRKANSLTLSLVAARPRHAPGSCSLLARTRWGQCGLDRSRANLSDAGTTAPGCRVQLARHRHRTNQSFRRDWRGPDGKSSLLQPVWVRRRTGASLSRQGKPVSSDLVLWGQTGRRCAVSSSVWRIALSGFCTIGDLRWFQLPPLARYTLPSGASPR